MDCRGRDRLRDEQCALLLLFIFIVVDPLARLRGRCRGGEDEMDRVVADLHRSIVGDDG